MPKQMLLADDSITIQKVIALTFAGEDYKITAVNNGVDAIAKAREIRPDIILADVVMPQKNGYEVSTEIKNDPDLNNIPVLLLAGTFEPFDEDEAKKALADGFIIKPFESQALIQKVKDLISKRPAKAGTPQPASKPSQVAPPAPPPKAPAPAPAPPAAPVRPVITPTPPVAPKPPVVSAPKPAAAQQVAPVPKAPSPPAAVPQPPDEQDFWGTMMEEVEGKTPAAKPAPVVTSVMAEPEDDVWDMGEVEEAPPAAAKGDEDIWESFAFEDKESKEEVLEPPSDDEMLFGTEEVEEDEIEEVPDFIEEEQIELAEEPTEIIKGYEQTFEPVSVKAPSIAKPQPASAPVSAALSEDQLRVELSKVSREVIEKIIWEVVPDLAEMLIKEEIKRLQKK